MRASTIAARVASALPVDGSLNENDGVAVVVADMILSASPYFQIDQGDSIHRPMTTSQTSVTGMKIFQPRRMIWS